VISLNCLGLEPTTAQRCRNLPSQKATFRETDLSGLGLTAKRSILFVDCATLLDRGIGEPWTGSRYSGITSQNRMNGNLRENPTRPTLAITPIEVVTIDIKTPAITFCTTLGILLDNPTV
jgi:hypothetical protein